VTDDGFRSALARELAEDALERFLRYVQIDTESDADSPAVPSTPKQLDLSRLLVVELHELGVEDAELDEQSGVVYASLPPNVSGARAIGLLAHVDTSSDVAGADVKPRRLRYEGGSVPLPGDPAQVLSPEEWPELADHVGHEIVTTDGTTLLGADDKAGIAEIMAAVGYLVRNPDHPRGPLKLAFTPDEEIGRGVDNFDLARFGAEVAYTLDGSKAGQVQGETFSALEARVKRGIRASHSYHR
jgi:tripeptide aminopeptidase